MSLIQAIRLGFREGKVMKRITTSVLLLFVSALVVSVPVAAQTPGNLENSWVTGAWFASQVLVGPDPSGVGTWVTRVTLENLNPPSWKFMRLQTVTQDGNEMFLLDSACPTCLKSGVSHHWFGPGNSWDQTREFVLSAPADVPLQVGWLTMDQVEGFYAPFVAPAGVKATVHRELLVDGELSVVYEDTMSPAVRLMVFKGFYGPLESAGISLVNVSAHETARVKIQAVNSDESVFAEMTVDIPRQSQVSRYDWKVFEGIQGWNTFIAAGGGHYRLVVDSDHPLAMFFRQF